MIMDRQSFLACSGLQVRTLDVWLEQQWLLPEETDAGLWFSDMDVARARLIQELAGAFGINEPGIDLILHLVDQMHGLRWALNQVRQDALKRDS
jgi:chaperone modulatory protein CbpM